MNLSHLKRATKSSTKTEQIDNGVHQVLTSEMEAAALPVVREIKFYMRKVYGSWLPEAYVSLFLSSHTPRNKGDLAGVKRVNGKLRILSSYSRKLVISKLSI